MPEKDPFYVGYLPLPASIKRFLLPWVIGNLVLAVAVGFAIASQHREPGDGVWDTSQAVTIQGFIFLNDPYPLLRTPERTYILVEQGKLGVQERLADEDFEYGLVEVTGYIVEREGRTVLELDGSLERPIESLSVDALTDERYAQMLGDFDDPLRQPDYLMRESLGTHTLVGEIVDPKCYLGVMQPGDGKTHKICATLCIAGGIPPMFLVRDADGNTAAYLLTDAQGNAFPESHYAYIADPVRLSGEVFRQGDLLLLRADLDSIQRLGAAD